MKNYREVIHLAVFSGYNMFASIVADRIRFTETGDVFLYNGGVIVGHILPESAGNLIIDMKWTNVSDGVTTFFLNYWLNV